MKPQLKNFLLALMFMSALPVISQGQCKHFVKKKCMKQLAPYTSNGQLNTTILSPGQSADLKMTFYSGQSYRILVCGQEVLGTLQFQIYDADSTLLFDSKNDDSPNHWDFKMQNTQDLLIRVTVPKNNFVNGMVQDGCAAILVGFMSDSKKK